MILYEKARACPFVGNDLNDSDLQKYFHRAIVGTKAMSRRADRTSYKLENDSLSDEDCYNFTGLFKSV